jgi:hypothetical protein
MMPIPLSVEPMVIDLAIGQVPFLIAAVVLIVGVVSILSAALAAQPTRTRKEIVTPSGGPRPPVRTVRQPPPRLAA